ncbi:uncharacterized protein K452DRAFT_285520, partial [Aplosporella prunicola CBS 121167]
MADFMLRPKTYVLGDDPQRTHRINANSFQQSALLTVNGWQYAAFYQSKEAADSSVCLVTLSRRKLRDNPNEPEKGWEHLVFEDYEQAVDDGHNTISIGVARGDGTLHVSFDHHCDPLRYRSSAYGVATNPEKHAWQPSLFTETLNSLPGLSPSQLTEGVTYPRFVSMDDDMLFTYRVGQAGSGSDVLYHYSSTSHVYTFLGTHLTGEGNSPYINGLDYRNGKLHVSWTYRKFVEFEGANDPNSTVHKAQAGPNGPENNYSLCYMYSTDKGQSWNTSDGKDIANMSSELNEKKTVRPSTEGITVFDIPINSGILNQESQSADGLGGFHVLNREKWNGVETWTVYSRSPSGAWMHTPIQGFKPTETGSRGSVCTTEKGNIWAVLPGNTDSSLSLVRSLESEDYMMFETMWKGDGFDGEPLLDQMRLEEEGILSVFTRTDKDEAGRRKVVVIDFDLKGL